MSIERENDVDEIYPAITCRCTKCERFFYIVVSLFENENGPQIELPKFCPWCGEK